MSKNLPVQNVYARKIPEFIRLCIFDLDGTLVDSLADLAISVNVMLDRYGLPAISPAVVRRGIGVGVKALLFRCFAEAAFRAGPDCPRAIAQTGITEDRDPLTANDRASLYPEFGLLIEQAINPYRAYYYEHCTDATDWYPGISGWLDELTERGIRLAVLSNKPDDLSVKIIQALDTKRQFDLIEGPQSVGVHKPDPAGIYRIMKRLGVVADHTAMIGDSEVDVATGLNAGVFTCGITGGYGDEVQLRRSGCDLLIERS